MLFNSLEFLIFLPITFLLFWVTPHKFRFLPLLAASYYFYMYWNPRLVFLILFTTLVSYLCGILLEKARGKAAVQKLIVAMTLIACLGTLLFFKYFNFLYDAFYDLVGVFGGKEAPGFFTIMLPVGISFYTFQTASYVIDVWRGSVPAEKNFGYFALFVTFFPQLVAGPIERPGDLLPQLKARRYFKNIDWSGAFRYMLLGFFKKIAVADAVGVLVNSVYENPSAANGIAALLATFLFALQIFCDFSGYSDIAVGCAKLFGINLTENFKAPYSAVSIKEFWNRWHLSLSCWLRDYIYFPLGGSRVGTVRRYFNVFVVFFVSGLWHGASYNFIIWGLLHAFFQIVGALTIKYRNAFWQRIGKTPESRLVKTLRRLGVFLLVSFAWIFFRANTLTDAFTIIGKIFTDWSNIGATLSLLSLTLPVFLYLLAIFAILPLMEKIKHPNCEKPLGEKSRFFLYAAMTWCIVIVWVYLQAANVGSSFIYFQF